MRLCFWEVLKDGGRTETTMEGGAPSRSGRGLLGVLAGQGGRQEPPRAAVSV